MNNSLNDIFNFSNMSIEDLEAFLNQRKDEMKKKEILQNYEIKQLPPDKEGKAGRYWTKLNGKKVKKVRREDLEQMILDFHNESNKTFASVFDEFMKQRNSGVWIIINGVYPGIISRYFPIAEADDILIPRKRAFAVNTTIPRAHISFQMLPELYRACCLHRKNINLNILVCSKVIDHDRINILNTF